MHQRPLFMNVLTGGALGLAGDVICQQVLEKQEQFDWRRNFALTSFGGFYTGIVCYYVYKAYARILPPWFYKTPAREGMGGTMLDNFVHVPVTYTPAFFVYTGLIQGAGWEG